MSAFWNPLFLALSPSFLQHQAYATYSQVLRPLLVYSLPVFHLTFNIGRLCPTSTWRQSTSSFFLFPQKCHFFLNWGYFSVAVYFCNVGRNKTCFLCLEKCFVFVKCCSVTYLLCQMLCVYSYSVYSNLLNHFFNVQPVLILLPKIFAKWNILFIESSS